MYQVRWHGRGGQGAVTAAKVFGLALAQYGQNYAQSFPAFGVERRGAPVLAFTKIAETPILDRSQIYEPDFVVVLDPGLIQSVNVTAGLKAGGKVLINCSGNPPENLRQENCSVISVDATKIALEMLGKPIMNTAMVGALFGLTGSRNFECVEKAIEDSFPAFLAGKNIKAARAAFDEVCKKEAV